MITRNGIYYDLKNSLYRYKDENLTFVFSSKSHLDKFKARKSENRNKINASLSKRFGYVVDVNLLADIVLYKKIETRGFLILNEGNELCRNNLIYAGGKVMYKSYSD